MPERILIIEDDRELRELLVEVLGDAGYDPLPFASAGAALQALDDTGPGDLVLTDLIMPGMQGQELLAEVRRRAPELNVVVMTAFGSIESAIELVKAGALTISRSRWRPMTCCSRSSARSSRVGRAARRHSEPGSRSRPFRGDSSATARRCSRCTS